MTVKFAEVTPHWKIRREDQSKSKGGMCCCWETKEKSRNEDRLYFPNPYSMGPVRSEVRGGGIGEDENGTARGQVLCELCRLAHNSCCGCCGGALGKSPPSFSSGKREW